MLQLIGGLLELPWWLFLAFCPQNLGDGADLLIMVLLKNECSFSDG